jgi:hypothetical protein
MLFRDESAGKTPEPTKSTKKDRKKKKKQKQNKKTKKKKRGRGIIRKKNQRLLKYCEKRKVFFLGCRIEKIIC